MTFLNPAVLFGLLAAGIPVLIHLLNLRKLKKIEISTLFFLHELQKNKIKKIKLKQWLLLLLRVLIVLAIVTAFARPTVQSLSIGGSSTVKTTAVFILDDSYSMNVVDANGSKFNFARQYVKKHLLHLQEGDEAAVLFTSQSHSEKPQLTRNIKELLMKVEESRVSDISRPLHESVVRAAELMGGSDNFNKELYVLSDLQKSTLIADSLYTDMSAQLNGRVHVYVFPFKSKEPFNIGIDSFHVNSALLQKDRTITTTLYLHNFTGETVNNNVASLFINGERVAQKGYSLEQEGTTALQLEAVIKTSGYLELTAVVEDDDILADNKAYASVFVPEVIHIGVFEKQQGDSKYIEAALRADDSLKSIKADVLQLGQIAASNLEKYDMLFIVGADNRVTYDRLTRYVNGGGGVFLFPGSNNNASDMIPIANALGLPAMTLTNGTPENPLGIYFSSVDENHPLFNGIFRQKEKKGVDSPELFRLLTAADTRLGRSVVKLNSGQPVLTEFKSGEGTVLFMGLAPVPAWSTLPYKGIFIPLIYRSVYYLSAKDAAGSSAFAGDAIVLDMKKEPGKVYKLVKPGGTNEIIAGEKNTNGVITYTNTNVNGNYKLVAGGDVVGQYSVNHNARESRMEMLDVADLREYFTRLHSQANVHAIKNPDRSIDEVKEARYGAELWKWFIVAAFMLAIAESLIARNTKKEMASL